MPTGRGLFTNPRNTLDKLQHTLAYHIEEKFVDSGIKTSFIIWEEVVDITADQAVAAAAMPKKERGQQSNVVMFLMDILCSGPAPKSHIEERAAAHGFSIDQLKRAKQKMCIVAFKAQEWQGKWMWCLPQHAPQEPQQEMEL